MTPVSIEPVKEADPGAMELPVIVATVGWTAFKAVCIWYAALAKLVALARLTEALKL
jgi:hypothetical protein